MLHVILRLKTTSRWLGSGSCARHVLRVVICGLRRSSDVVGGSGGELFLSLAA